jgi:DNA modification methylase
MRCDGVILQGDCLDIMPTLDAESIDAVVTDRSGCGVLD